MGDILKLVVGSGAPILAGCLAFFRPMDAAKTVGSVLVMGGAVAYLSPIHFANFFGIPFADTTNTLFVPGIGGRMAATGITTLTLALLEERRAVGVLMGSWTVAGCSDIGLLMATKGSENVLEHARNTAVLMLISWRLLTTTI
ncbi:hypothetical protein BKA64DRAFT_124460 [Cadophora sp. MPI-SDFR-AT-0126]|nr:hypothetical protein BKA64DRAFT_124460 [Leotiomycetes sp. MPI-SDFR-AT-0126]